MPGGDLPRTPSGDRTPRLSIVVVARDEEERIDACLAAAGFAGELLVADTGSRDRTREIAGTRGARVVDLPWQGFGPTKAAALALATGDWILLLDADEVVSPELERSILDVVEHTDSAVAGFELTRRSFFLGRWMRHGGWGDDRVVRLVRRDRFVMSTEPVHERLTVRGRLGRLDGVLLHHTDPTLSRYLGKMMLYARLGAEGLARRGVRFRFHQLLLNPAATFWKRYLIKAGFLDGIPGFLLAVFSAVHVFVKYACLWELSRVQRDPGGAGR